MPACKIQDSDEIREDVREDVSSRGGSEPAVRPAGDAVSGEVQATESVIDNGDVEDKRAGEDAGRGTKILHTLPLPPIKPVPLISTCLIYSLGTVADVIEAEYREVEPEEAESEIDDYAIPDEPESYASNRDPCSPSPSTGQPAPP